MKLTRIVAIASIAAVALIGATAAVVPTAPPHPTAGPAVKVVVDGGHGSGVVIAGGYVVTAAHVAVDAGRTHDVVTDAGGSFSATVLWMNKDYDVALLRFDGTPEDITPAPLDCRTPLLGEPVRIVGSPLREDFISGWGRVSGSARRSGPWQTVVWLDLAAAPGDSGGPVYDDAGSVVGIVVGLLAMPGVASSAPLAMVAAMPAAVVCMLMARA
jgi:serine protease Do